jgi:DNA-binding MarR family transcriptional regulator
MRDAELLRYLVLAAQREGDRRLTRELRPLGVTPAQAEALRILGDHQPLSLAELGSMLVCESGSNPSRLVDRLVVAGLVERVADQNDRRLVSLSLTAAGKDVETAVRDVEEQLYGELDRATGTDGARELIAVLRRITDGTPAGAAVGRRSHHQRGRRGNP